ncbi:unnamed protein product, partial [Boreogadus saida]
FANPGLRLTTNTTSPPAVIHHRRPLHRHPTIAAIPWRGTPCRMHAQEINRRSRHERVDRHRHTHTQTRGAASVCGLQPACQKIHTHTRTHITVQRGEYQVQQEGTFFCLLQHI